MKPGTKVYILETGYRVRVTEGECVRETPKQIVVKFVPWYGDYPIEQRMNKSSDRQTVSADRGVILDRLKQVLRVRAEGFVRSLLYTREAIEKVVPS